MGQPNAPPRRRAVAPLAAAVVALLLCPVGGTALLRVPSGPGPHWAMAPPCFWTADARCVANKVIYISRADVAAIADDTGRGWLQRQAAGFMCLSLAGSKDACASAGAVNPKFSCAWDDKLGCYAVSAEDGPFRACPGSKGYQRAVCRTSGGAGPDACAKLSGQGCAWLDQSKALMGYTPPKGAKPLAACVMADERDMVMRGGAGIKEFGRQASTLDASVIGDCWTARTSRQWGPLCNSKGGKKECEDASPVCIWKPLPAVPGVLNPSRDGDCIVSGTGQMLQVLKGDDAAIRSAANVCGLLSGTSAAKCQATGGADVPINLDRLQAIADGDFAGAAKMPRDKAKPVAASGR